MESKYLIIQLKDSVSKGTLFGIWVFPNLSEDDAFSSNILFKINGRGKKKFCCLTTKVTVGVTNLHSYRSVFGGLAGS